MSSVTLRPYGELTWQHFSLPRHAGLPQDEPLLHAAASTPAADAQVEVGVSIRAGETEQAGFVAHAAPEVIAALDLFCERITERSLRAMDAADLQQIAAELNLPPEKRYGLLLLQDLLAALQSDLNSHLAAPT